MPRKRRRTRFVRRNARPVDKNIVNFNLNLTGNGQAQGTLWPPAASLGPPAAGAIFPGTITGIRWCIDFCYNADNDTTGGFVCFAWAIVRLRESQNPSTLVVNGAAGISTMYRPEQDIIVCGTSLVPLSNNTAHVGVTNTRIEGKTKTMRKLQNGDRVIILAQDSDTTDNDNTVYGMVEYFIKT